MKGVVISRGATRCSAPRGCVWERQNSPRLGAHAISYHSSICFRVYGQWSTECWSVIKSALHLTDNYTKNEHFRNDFCVRSAPGTIRYRWSKPDQTDWISLTGSIIRKYYYCIVFFELQAYTKWATKYDEDVNELKFVANESMVKCSFNLINNDESSLMLDIAAGSFFWNDWLGGLA